jgi:hypothetical protein
VTAPGATSSTNPVLTPEDIKAQYGFVAALAQAIPEINTLLQQAVAGQWSASRFQMAIANTQWWKTTGDTARNWLVTQLSDPATATHEMQDGGNKIGVIAGQLGIGTNLLDSTTAQQIWLQTQLQGMSDDQVKAYIAQQEAPALSKYAAGGGAVGGSIGSTIDQMTQMAANYGYTPPDLQQEVMSWAQGAAGTALTGGDAISGWQSKMQNYATVKYAPFADQIKQGQTVADISKPYTDAYQNTLEQPGHGLQDPLVQKALQGTPDAKGQVQATPLWQFQQSLRSDPRWAQTDNARQATAQAVTQIGKTFGFMGN